MEVPADVSQEMEAMRLMQQQAAASSGQQNTIAMMPSEHMLMAPQGHMGQYYISPHMPHFVPHQSMGQPGVHPSNPKARLQCHACSKLLEYDAGAQYVQCFSCSTMNSVQLKTQIGGRVLSMLCAMCSTTNLAPFGVNYVRCGNCHTISQVSHAYRMEPHGNCPGRMLGPGQQHSQRHYEGHPDLSLPEDEIDQPNNNGEIATATHVNENKIDRGEQCEYGHKTPGGSHHA